MRSTVQPYSAVVTIATSSTSSSSTGTAVMPNDTKIRKAISEMKPPIMKMSPWAKLIMPTMP